MIVCRAVSHGSTTKLPLFSMTIPAGPPTIAENQIDEHIDLAQYLTPRPERSFLVRVEGDSMIDAGINHGDLLVVERQVEARNGDIVVAVIAGQFTVKTFRRSHGRLVLVAANKDNPEPLRQEFSVWGVARYAIHKL